MHEENLITECGLPKRTHARAHSEQWHSCTRWPLLRGLLKKRRLTQVGWRKRVGGRGGFELVKESTERRCWPSRSRCGTADKQSIMSGSPIRLNKSSMWNVCQEEAPCKGEPEWTLWKAVAFERRGNAAHCATTRVECWMAVWRKCVPSCMRYWGATGESSATRRAGAALWAAAWHRPTWLAIVNLLWIQSRCFYHFSYCPVADHLFISIPFLLNHNQVVRLMHI